jgi:GT2 family glycosyltransferase/SAM-dependent methyltransferase/Tfp pilus assembly protein PilF
MNELPTDPAEIYSKDYYDRYGSESGIPYERDQPTWQNHFGTLARTLIERYRPRTTLDVGCAKGFLVEHLRDGGVEAFGLDVSPYAISQVREDIRPYCHVATGAGSMTGQFDLITCIEVAEHMPEPVAKAAIVEMCAHSDQIIFSSTPDGFEEPTHINLHPAEYWIELFQQQGFFPDRNFEPGFITPQALRFLRCKKPTLQVAVFSHEPPNCAVALLRLAGTIRHLESQNRMKLEWHTARNTELDIKKLFACDIFTIHREFCDAQIGSPIIGVARELRKPLVFELDDLLINLPKTNPNHKYCASITPDILATLRAADFVTVTTEPLKRYLEEAEPQSKGKIHVLPNFINLDIWGGAKPPPEKPEDPFVIGWFGTATHDEDLAIIKPAIVELARKYAGKLVFKFWGYLPEDLKNIPGVKLVRGSQPDLKLHARDVVNSRIDLAIAPLLDHPFNHAKSDLKWLEYSICYIPGIYSTISPYTGSVEHGRTGWLVDNKPELWVEAIERFMHDHELRRSIAIQAHDEVHQKRCVEVGAEQWDALYRSFVMSGPKPHVSRNISPLERAVGFLMQYGANTLACKGAYQQALRMSQQAIVRSLPLDSSEGRLISDVLRLYHSVLAKQEEMAGLAASLNAAKLLADTGHSPAAIDLYRQTLKSALQSSTANTVLRVILDIARAYKTLDPEQGRKLIEVAANLSKNLGSKSDMQSAEQLRTEYAKIAPGSAVISSKTTPPAKLGSSAPVKSKSLPAVSIIIPVFNNLALTQACFESLDRTRTKAEYEIIVVDNASTDGTAEYLGTLETEGTIRVITNPSNKGFAHACNQGAQAARGAQLLFLNNDTRVTDGWLDALLKAGGQSNVGVVGAKLLYADGTIQHAGIEFINGIPDHVHRRASADLPTANKLRELDMVTGACLMTPRNVFLKIGGFDEVFRNGVEDIDYCLRVRALGRKVVYQPQSVVYHHEGQTAGRFDHVNDNLKTFFGRWTNSFDKNFRYIVPLKSKTIAASLSLLLTAAPSASSNPSKTAIVSWEGSFLDYGSLSHVNRELVALLKGAPDIKIHCVAPGNSTNSPTEKIWPELTTEISARPATNAAVTVRHAWPPNWQRPVTGKLAVIQPWEFGALPREWIEKSQDVDEFWVPSACVRDAYIASGVEAKKMVIVPNGVDPDKFHPRATPMKLTTLKKFKFLFVGGTIGRKGPDLLLQAWLKNFTAADDVCLVIKDFGGKSVYAGQTFETQIQAARSIPHAPEILYLNEELPPDLLPGLYTACNCFVLPYRGEGFGLPVLEAMACSLPVIVTAGGATDDFVSDEFAWRIPAIKKVFGHEVSGMKLAGDGWLLEPDLAALGKAMRTAFTNPAACRERGQLASRHARENWSWKKAAKIVAERIQRLAADQNSQAPAAAKPADMEIPSVAQIGRLSEARELFKQKKLEVAWEATLAAISKRPFHPEAYLLLAEIALAAGDASSAKSCAKQARDMAPGLTSVKRFLNHASKSNSKPQWLKLPETVQNPSEPRLSVCLIAKNEEKFLAQCLKSVRDIAHQMIVVDTGSTDNTVTIAKEFGAEIYSFKWCDDFSAARNVALEHATGDWILILDADEEIPAEQHPKLLADMKNPSVAACRLPLVNRGKEADGRNFVPRLFRNAPGVFFFGRIHEQVFSSLLPLCKSWGLSTAMGAAEILHHGYTNEMMQDRNKVERNLKLLQQANQENPGDVILTMNLGLELVRSGNLTDGVAKYREAFQLMSQLPPREVTPESREALLTQFTSQLYKINAHHEVIEVLNSPLAKDCGLTASLHFALGLSLFALGNFQDAAEQIRQCLATRKQSALSPINTDILTAMPNHCLALSLAKIGDKAGAEKAFEAALAENNGIEEAKLDYAKFLVAENRPVEALHKLREMITANCRNVLAWRTGGEIALGRPEFLGFARDWTGEAIRYVSEDSLVRAQRAETLMLSGDTAAAIELWESLWNHERQPRTLAALILCQAIESPTTHAPEEGTDEATVSRAFIAWYQRLITMRSKTAISRLNEQMDKLSRALPTAAQRIGKALSEAQQPKVVA